MIDFSTKTTSTSVFVEAKDQGEVVGLARAYGDSISMMEVVHTYQCSDDLIDISYEYPQVMDGEDIRILEVNVVSLSKDYQGKGIGSEIYQKLIEGWSKRVRKPFVIIPEKCSVSGSTSDMAMRVWESLKRKHPSSGLCVVIDL
jgi:GNAT superfamily N-acetyltransferase